MTPLVEPLTPPPPLPAPAAAGVSRRVDGRSARMTFCTAVTMKSSPVVTIGSRGRQRSPASPPSSAPTPSPVTTNAQELAPCSECFATYGPSTKKGAYVIRK